MKEEIKKYVKEVLETSDKKDPETIGYVAELLDVTRDLCF